MVRMKIECPDCGQRLKAANALGPHRGSRVCREKAGAKSVVPARRTKAASRNGVPHKGQLMLLLRNEISKAASRVRILEEALSALEK